MNKSKLLENVFNTIKWAIIFVLLISSIMVKNTTTKTYLLVAILIIISVLNLFEGIYFKERTLSNRAEIEKNKQLYKEFFYFGGFLFIALALLMAMYIISPIYYIIAGVLLFIMLPFSAYKISVAKK